MRPWRQALVAAAPAIGGALYGARAEATAAAPVEVRISVERGPESQACPDAAGVLAAANALFPEAPLRAFAGPAEAPVNVAVRVSRVADGHEARIVVSGERRGERRIVDRDDACRGLGDAMAVALVLLVEPDRPRAGAAATRAEAPMREPATGEESEGATRLQASVEAGGLASAGLLGQPAFGGWIGLGLWHRWGLGAHARGLRLSAMPTDRAEGRVQVDLWAIAAGPCWRASLGPRWGLGACLELAWGRQRGIATGFEKIERSGSADWLVIGPNAMVEAALVGPLVVAATGGLTANLHEHHFSITPLGPIQTQEPVGAYLGLGLGARWPPPAGHR